jgi:transcriptional regulator with XRE-family HTH domain
LQDRNWKKVTCLKERFDNKGFFAALDAQRAARRMTWKQVAEESGVAASTLTRMAQGKRPDVDGLAALVRWSGLKVDGFMGAEDAPPAEPLAQISTLLHADTRLSAQNRTALEHMLRAAYEQLRNDKEEGAPL